MKKKIIQKWPSNSLSGAKRANIANQMNVNGEENDWFEGFGKSENCRFEGTWWDMICFARNVLADQNTKLAAPEFYKPEWKNDNYVGREISYEFKPRSVKDV